VFYMFGYHQSANGLLREVVCRFKTKKGDGTNHPLK
jgi:hypothetical protein